MPKNERKEVVSLKIHTSDVLELPASVVTIGAFDGVHKGHQCLLSKAKERARQLDVPFVVYTFDPPPKVYFNNCILLTTLDEKKQLMKQFGVDHLIVGTFNEAFMNREVPMFIEELKKMHPLELWEGPNFQFGKGRKGNIEVLRCHFNVNVLHPVVSDEHELISSSRIRQLIQQGHHLQAEHLLGWNLFASISK